MRRSVYAPPTDHRSGSGIRVSNICRGTRPGLSANIAPQREEILPRQSACRDRPAYLGRHHKGAMDLRAGPSAAERGTWPRPLRRTIVARLSSACAHDDDRLCLPSVSSSQKSEAGKKESTDRPLNQACPPSVTPSSSSSLDCRFGDVRTAEDRSPRSRSVNKSAKVVLISWASNAVVYSLLN